MAWMGHGTWMGLLFWGGVITLAFFALRALMRSGRGQDEARPRLLGEGTALEILQKRYAQGDISRDEYLEMKQDLET